MYVSSNNIRLYFMKKTFFKNVNIRWPINLTMGFPISYTIYHFVLAALRGHNILKIILEGRSLNYFEILFEKYSKKYK